MKCSKCGSSEVRTSVVRVEVYTSCEYCDWGKERSPAEERPVESKTGVLTLGDLNDQLKQAFPKFRYYWAPVTWNKPGSSGP